MPSRVPASDRLTGLAHVATVSFLASRVAPSGQFWAALGGGMALARAGEKHGLRAGYGASAAAMLETVAMIGPARIQGPLTQALNAPLMGVLHARRAPLAAVFAAALVIRLAHYVVLNATFVWLVFGSLDAYVDTYDRIAGFLRVLPEGRTAALVLTVLANLGWAVFYSGVQTLAYHRALRRWPGAPGVERGPDRSAEAARVRPPRRALLIAAIAVAGWTALLASPSWPVLGATTAVLVAAWLVAPGRSAKGLKLGLILAAILALGAIGPALLGVVETEEAVRRAIRAALLVLVATWARAAAGADGVRTLTGAALWRLRRLPAAREAAGLAAMLRSDRRLSMAGRDLLDRLDEVPMRPVPIADALTAWVAAESAAAPD